MVKPYVPSGDGPAGLPIFENLVWLSSAEAAAYLRKSPGAIRIAVCRGHLPAHKWKRRLYFKKADLDYAIAATSFRKEGA